MLGDTDNLPPTQYLVMEVLAARHRLGDNYWTFPSSCWSPIRALVNRGYVYHKDGITEHTERVWLTDEGFAAWGLDKPYPPFATGGIIPQPNGPTMNLLHAERRGFLDGIAHLFRNRKAPH